MSQYFTGPDTLHIYPATMHVEGVGPHTPTVANDAGAKQSEIPYRCDLLPPLACLRIAGVLRDGAAKYGEDNWRGLPISDHLNHALTHIFAALSGDCQDDHIGHAACRLMMALDTREYMNVTLANSETIK